ncbi:MAG: hypothetical protein HY774_22825 [Acidobacteria bacterium]|nr:hypothetical protein [Acidobacteriota bacterium]
MNPLPPPVKLNPYFFPRHPGEQSSLRAWLDRKGPLIVCLSIVLVILGVLRFAQYRWEQDAPQRQVITRIHQEVSPGMSFKEASAIVNKYKTPEITVGYAPNLLSASTPLEFGASNWELWIIFENGSVQAVRIRTEDSPIPGDAPPDKESVEPNRRVETVEPSRTRNW